MGLWLSSYMVAICYMPPLAAAPCSHSSVETSCCFCLMPLYYSFLFLSNGPEGEAYGHFVVKCSQLNVCLFPFPLVLLFVTFVKAETFPFPFNLSILASGYFCFICKAKNDNLTVLRQVNLEEHPLGIQVCGKNSLMTIHLVGL